MRRSLLALALAGAAALAPATAAAEFTPLQVLSVAGRAQGNNGTDSVALAAAGSYAVFHSFATTLDHSTPPAGEQWAGGIFRRNLSGGEPELVVPGVVTYEDGRLPAQVTTLPPSISADGRFVAFTTTQQLVAADTNTVQDAYVRDMSIPYGAPGAFVLASAQDGSGTPITYGGDGTLGSHTGASALSDDGTKLVVLVDAPSDAAGAETPASTIVVRDLAAKTTTLVSRAAAGGPATVPDGFPPTDIALSADGTTVIWNTFNASQQIGTPPQLDQLAQLVWRRVADGAAAPTRLVTGPYDTDDPACGPGGQLTKDPAPGPCDGPFLVGVTGDSSARTVTSASISRDGLTVAVAAFPNRNDPDAGGANDLYLVRMTPGLSRKQAITRYTSGPDPRSGAGVGQAALSPDGTWLAFSATAWTPAQNPPSPLGSFPKTSLFSRAYAIDLRAQTVEAISRAYNGDDPDQAVASLAVADGGERIAFTSGSTNLFFGDANGADDALFTSMVHRVPAPVRVELPVPFQAPLVPLEYRLGATAAARRDGTVTVSILVPGAGRVKATSRLAPLAVTASGKKPARRPLAGPAKTAIAPKAGFVKIGLGTSSRYARLVRGSKGLPASITVTFTPAAKGAKSLTRTVPITFRRRASSAKGKS